MHNPVYLDYNATTPVDPAVVEAMTPYLHERFGNPSSAHAYGYEAEDAVVEARHRVANLIGARPDEIVFTAGGSEADNLAIKGVVFAHLGRSPHVITLATEHPAVLNTLAYLRERFGVAITVLPVNTEGRVEPDAIRAAIRPQTVLLTILHANNEVGTVQSIRELSDVAHEAGVLVHVDAAQSAGKIPVNVDHLRVDLLTVAGHKLYAPKGIGALYVRRGTSLDPLIHGGGQERGLRAGTENVAFMVGLGEASDIAGARLDGEAKRLRTLRDELHRLLAGRVPGALLNGHPVDRLPNTLNISLPGASGDGVLACTPEVAASTGSACHAGSTEPSRVLMAMGLSRGRALGAIRLSLGRWTTREDVDRAADALAHGYEKARTAAGSLV